MLKKKNLLLLLIMICFIFIFGFLSILWLITPVALESKDFHVKVDGYVGINLDQDKIYFGTVSPGGTGKRDVTLSVQKDSFVKIDIQGDILPWLVVKESSFIIASGEGKKVLFEVHVPRSTTFGNYSGVVNFIFYRKGAALFLK